MMGPSAVLMHADLAGTSDHLDKFLERIRHLDVHFMPPETLLAPWLTGRFI
jgi:hypothetical protein